MREALEKNQFFSRVSLIYIQKQITSSETSTHLNNKAHATPLQLTHYTQLLLLKKSQRLEKELTENQTKHHAEASLPPALNDFKLLESCVADLNGKEMRDIELAILKDPLNMKAQNELRDRTDKMTRLYATEI